MIPKCFAMDYGLWAMGLKDEAGGRHIYHGITAIMTVVSCGGGGCGRDAYVDMAKSEGIVRFSVR